MKNNHDLFGKPDKARYGDPSLRQNLFLPKMLSDKSPDYRLRGEGQDNAFQIIQRWADLETSGKLKTKNETAIEGEFLTEIFGEALGYTLFSENKQQWNLTPKLSVNGGIADAALGTFEDGEAQKPIAVIELKGPNTNLDRDRFNGRTAVQQCWDYLNKLPDCPWGIVSNYVSFRLYHRNHSSRSYQLFVLNDLRSEDAFREFYYLFEKNGLIPRAPDRPSRAHSLLEQTGERQREVGDELYRSYDLNRRKMIHYLTQPPRKIELEKSIGISQKLLDRIIFIAFCEDRGLLPQKSIEKAYKSLPPFAKVTNPRWRNFLNLFRSVDEGNPQADISAYNGGLFRKDPEVDDLNLDDSWTDFFLSIGKYDFRDEVNVDVLGHLFEKSIRDIGHIRLGRLFEGSKGDDENASRMTKSAERKRFGIYYTPPEFTRFIVKECVGRVILDRMKDLADKQDIVLEGYKTDKPSKKHASFWRDCLAAIRNLKIVDPACGSGAFLIAAYDILEEKYLDILDYIGFHNGDDIDSLIEQIPAFILRDNLFGVDLSLEAVEITQLALWIRSAQPGKTLADLSKNIVCGNSLVTDQDVHQHAMTWEERFAGVFERAEAGFDCVIGNPPWERIKLQEREFFDAVEPSIAAAVNAATRRKLIADLKKTNPDLHERYLKAKADAEKTLNHVRKSGRFPLTGKGDINTYATFAELAHSIVAPSGRVGLLVPSGIATDHTTREFFGTLTDTKVLAGLYDFENKKKIFPDVDGRFKFCVLLFGGEFQKTAEVDFVFFAHQRSDLDERYRHIALSSDDIKLLNPNTRTCPIFRTTRDAELTKSIYRRVPVLVDQNRKEGGNPWGIRFLRMFDQTNDAELFKTVEWFKKNKYKRDGPIWLKGKQMFLPLYEAKMVQMYDHRAASVVVNDENWMRQGQTASTDLVQHQNPEFSTAPRWWVGERDVNSVFSADSRQAFLTYKDVTSATNQRTMIASFIPPVGTLNSAPLILTHADTPIEFECCLLANLNSLALDFAARQKVGGVHLNFFIVEQLPIFTPETYSQQCPWEPKVSLAGWISDSVLKLSCTSNDMIPLAKAAGFKPSVYKWKPAERAELMAELDAAYFHLYGIARDDVEYILSTFSGVKKEQGGLFDSTATYDLVLKHFDRLQKTARGSK